ncbi:hypothetical protein GQ600_22369 [Phytophthora cactorum]|nr:hypothetical protein GQ600_22369 [Phytophthora cactorum]
MVPLFEEEHVSASSSQRDGRVRMAKRGLRSEPVATRKRRRLVVATDTRSSTSTYGGAVAFKHARKELLKDGWTLDDRYRFIWPGGDLAGKEDLDFLLGEAAVMRFVKVPTSAPNSGTDTGERRNSRNSGSRGRDDAGRGRGDIRRGEAEDEPDHATAGGRVQLVAMRCSSSSTSVATLERPPTARTSRALTSPNTVEIAPATSGSDNGAKLSVLSCWRSGVVTCGDSAVPSVCIRGSSGELERGEGSGTAITVDPCAESLGVDGYPAAGQVAAGLTIRAGVWTDGYELGLRLDGFLRVGDVTSCCLPVLCPCRYGRDGGAAGSARMRD